jgi:teichuronic acid biosynthesis glycosyltransferase TuaC
MTSIATAPYDLESRRECKPLTILVVTNLFPYAGDPTYGTFVHEQVEALRNHPLVHRVDVEFINGRSGKMAYLRSLRAVRHATRGAVYDIVHAHHGLAGAVAVLGARRVPNVITFHGSDIAYYPTQRLISRFASRRAAAVICVAEHLKAQLRVPAQRIACGIDTRMFTPLPRAEARLMFGVPTNSLAVLFPGNPHRRQKRYDRFCRVLDALRSDGIDAHELRLQGVARDCVPHLMAAADVAVLTSESEGAPVALMEALACGLPIVATDIGGVREVIGSARNTFVSDFDAELFARAALKLGDSSASREAAPESKALDVRFTADRLVSLYLEVKARREHHERTR